MSYTIFALQLSKLCLCKDRFCAMDHHLVMVTGAQEVCKFDQLEAALHCFMQHPDTQLLWDNTTNTRYYIVGTSSVQQLAGCAAYYVVTDNRPLGEQMCDSYCPANPWKHIVLPNIRIVLEQIQQQQQQQPHDQDNDKNVMQVGKKRKAVYDIQQ
mgnify:CR=1 FL=1